MAENLHIMHANTPVNLTTEQVTKINTVIKELINQMAFFNELVQGCIDKTTVDTHMSLLEYALTDLSDLTGYTSIKQEKLRHEQDAIRAQNIRIHELESQLGKGVTANAVEGALRRYEQIARGWYEAFGFHYASISNTSYGLTLEFSSELAYSDESHLSHDDFYAICTKHLTSVKDLDGISINTEPGSTCQHILDTDANKQLLLQQIQEQFPNYRLFRFSSRPNCGQWLLRTEIMLTYPDLEAFESRMLALDATTEN